MQTIQLLKDTGHMPGNANSIAAGAIYLACQLTQHLKSAKSVSKVTGVTECTIRIKYNAIVEQLNKTPESDSKPILPDYVENLNLRTEVKDLVGQYHAIPKAPLSTWTNPVDLVTSYVKDEKFQLSPNAQIEVEDRAKQYLNDLKVAAFLDNAKTEHGSFVSAGIAAAAVYLSGISTLHPLNETCLSMAARVYTSTITHRFRQLAKLLDIPGFDPAPLVSVYIEKISFVPVYEISPDAQARIQDKVVQYLHDPRIAPLLAFSTKKFSNTIGFRYSKVAGIVSAAFHNTCYFDFDTLGKVAGISSRSVMKWSDRLHDMLRY
jgi:hypothetical protein